MFYFGVGIFILSSIVAFSEGANIVFILTDDQDLELQGLVN